jgi:hypothetical protein
MFHWTKPQRCIPVTQASYFRRPGLLGRYLSIFCGFLAHGPLGANSGNVSPFLPLQCSASLGVTSRNGAQFTCANQTSTMKGL